MEAVVLTSENSAEFYARRLNLAPEPSAAPSKDGEPGVESAATSGGAKPAVEAVDEQHPDPEKRQRINLRFSELSKQRDEAKAEAEKQAAEAKASREARELAEKRAQEAEAKRAELEQKLAPAPPEKSDELGPEPKPEQFTDAFEYAKALAEYSADKALATRDKEQAEAKKAVVEQERAEAFKKRQEATKAEIPDYEAAINAAADLKVSNEVREAIIDSEVGPKILHHLATNRDVVARLAALPVGKALIEIGKLEAKFEAAGPKPTPNAAEGEKAAAVVAASEPSRAPAPITPLKGASPVAAASVDSAGVFYGSYAEYKAQRKAGKIK